MLKEESMRKQDMTRREWCTAMLKTIGAGMAASAVIPAVARAAGAPIAITVYKDPSCGCCKNWVAHLSANGFAPVAKDRTDMDTLKDSLGVPAALRSCHTAVVGRYVIEGHVPAADVKKLLGTTPKGVLGLAVPGMPAGSPGMEMGARADRYDVVAYSAGGKTTTFGSYGK